MKTGNYYLSLAVVIGLLCVPILGEVEPAMPDGTLLGQPNPALAGIMGLNVTIIPTCEESDKNGLVWKELEQNIISKLKNAGVTAAVLIDGKFSLFSYDAPNLRICINILKLSDSQKYVFHIQNTLARTVILPGQQNLYFKTDVWETEPVMKEVSEENMQAAVTSAISEQVEAFIHAYLAANPPDKQAPDGNDIGIIPKEQPKPAVKSIPASQQGEPAEYKYVASKNSNVFHRPNCSSAKRIKPENLVGYRSRDEAINTGKRPCKRCKP
jgi:hypothetical protein